MVLFHVHIQFYPLTISNGAKQANTHFNCMKNIYNIHDISSFLQDAVFFFLKPMI